MRLRVVSGIYKRRKLLAPPGIEVTRPTTDRVKESLFNILSERIEESIVLDLFAGTGQLGIESLSRGAKKVIFVESNRTALEFLKRNLDMLGVAENMYRIYPMTVEKFLETQSDKVKQFLEAEKLSASIQVILADPPYTSPWYNQAIESLETFGLCRPDCILVMEKQTLKQGLNLPIASRVEGSSWNHSGDRKYGNTSLEIWEKN